MSDRVLLCVLVSFLELIGCDAMTASSFLVLCNLQIIEAAMNSPSYQLHPGMSSHHSGASVAQSVMNDAICYPSIHSFICVFIIRHSGTFKVSWQEWVPNIPLPKMLALGPEVCTARAITCLHALPNGKNGFTRFLV